MAVLPPTGKTEGPVLLEQALRFDVYYTDDYETLTGTHSTEVENEGWRWDRRIAPVRGRDATRYLTYAGGHSVGLLDGTNLTDWVSGVLNGLDYVGLTFKQRKDRLRWIPQVHTGAYSVFWDVRDLYSDYSVSNNVLSASIANGVWVSSLPADAVYGSLSARIYQRLSTFDVMTFREYEYVEDFTGAYSGGSFLDTRDALGNIIYANISTRRYEFLVEGGDVIFNTSDAYEVGNTSTDPDVIRDTWEDVGASQVGRSIYAKFFPLDQGNVQVASVSNTGVVTIYSEQATLNYSEATDNHFAVDYDLGIITMGGEQPDALTIKEPVGLLTTDEIVVYIDPEVMDQYPDYGILEVGTEKIFYQEKGPTGFKRLTRAYGGTTAALHSIGDQIQGVQRGAASSGDLYIAYHAVPRVEYEVTDHRIRTSARYSWLDIRATSNIDSNDIFQLQSYDPNLARIELTIDKPHLGGAYYGPLAYGTDVARLTATAYDYYDNPVEDMDITIYIESGGGYLNGSSTSVTGTTNSLGQVYAYYNSPYSDADAFKEVVSTTHSGADTVMEVTDAAPFTSPDDVWVFQVLKHDPLFGTVGLQLEVTDAGTAIGYAPNILGYIEVDGILSEDYEGGLIYVVDTSAIKRRFRVEKVVPVLDGSGVTRTKVYTRELVNAATVIGQQSWSLRRDALEWDSSAKRGAKVILYEWSLAAQHPLTGAAGAYAPVHPDTVSGNLLTFSGRNLPIPRPSDDTENLGGYVVVMPGSVSFRAKGLDPYSGTTILSNQVKVQLQMPSFLTGVDTSGILPVPYGFTFVTSSFNVGSGLGGANFITVNPRSSGINQFNLYRSFP